ncbi:MAG: flagellar protein FlaG [Gammaproteobacteria bacterium]|nr:flagellar protein FlaG [Gammaproteobacteria bacterium]
MSIEQTTYVMSQQQLTSPSRKTVAPSEGKGVVDTARQSGAVNNGNAMPVAKSVDEEVSAESQKKQLSQAVSDLNDFVQNIQRNVYFSVDDDTGRTIVRVVDRETDELIRQIPSEEVLNIARSLEEQIASNKNDGLILQVQA